MLKTDSLQLLNEFLKQSKRWSQYEIIVYVDDHLFEYVPYLTFCGWWFYESAVNWEYSNFVNDSFEEIFRGQPSCQFILQNKNQQWLISHFTLRIWTISGRPIFSIFCWKSLRPAPTYYSTTNYLLFLKVLFFVLSGGRDSGDRTIWHLRQLTPRRQVVQFDTMRISRTIWHLRQFDTILTKRTIWHHHNKKDKFTNLISTPKPNLIPLQLFGLQIWLEVNIGHLISRYFWWRAQQSPQT